MPTFDDYVIYIGALVSAYGDELDAMAWEAIKARLEEAEHA
jgi:hypothetical protein